MKTKNQPEQSNKVTIVQPTKKLTHHEKVEGIAECFRQLRKRMNKNIGDETIPIFIGVGRTLSCLIMADQREELLESRRNLMNNDQDPRFFQSGKKMGEARNLRKINSSPNTDVIK